MADGAGARQRPTFPKLPPVPEQTPEQLAEVRRRAIEFIDGQGLALLVTAGESWPSGRLLGFAREDGFVIHIVSVKPSKKLDQLERNPNATVLWYSLDGGVVRLVQVQGRAEVRHDLAGFRAIEDKVLAGIPHASRLPDDEVMDKRAGITIHPVRVRTEGLTDTGRQPVWVAP